jgi:hypothetical protein
MLKGNRLNSALGKLHMSARQLTEAVAKADNSRYLPAIEDHLLKVWVELEKFQRLYYLDTMKEVRHAYHARKNGAGEAS